MQQRLADNKRFAARNTKVPSLLQGLAACAACGYGYYRTSARTARRKIYYYRCLGSDDYRYEGGRVCGNKQPTGESANDEASSRIHSRSPVRPSPACNPRMEREPLGISPGFAPRSHLRHTPGRGRSTRTGPGITPLTSINPPSANTAICIRLRVAQPAPAICGCSPTNRSILILRSPTRMVTSRRYVPFRGITDDCRRPLLQGDVFDRSSRDRARHSSQRSRPPPAGKRRYVISRSPDPDQSHMFAWLLGRR